MAKCCTAAAVAAVLCAAAMFIGAAMFVGHSQDGSMREGHATVRFQLQQRIWNSGAFDLTSNVFKRCAHGNNKACNALAGNLGAVESLERIDAQTPHSFAAKHPHKAEKKKSKRQPSHLYRANQAGKSGIAAQSIGVRARTSSLTSAGGASRKAAGRTNLAAHEEYDSSKAEEYSATNPDKEFLKKSKDLAAEAQNEYAIEEGVRSSAGAGFPTPGGKWGGGLEEFGVDTKGNPIQTTGYAFMP